MKQFDHNAGLHAEKIQFLTDSILCQQLGQMLRENNASPYLLLSIVFHLFHQKKR